MEYDVKLPQNIDRFGFGEDMFNFGNWYPILAVYDEKGWNLDPYYSLGDPPFIVIWPIIKYRLRPPLKT